MNAKNKSLKGRVTLPAEKGMEKEVILLADKWGVDAVRDSDGTELSAEILQMGFEVYTTLCLIREDQEWLKQHREYLQQMYLCSKPAVAESETLEAELLKGYFREQFEIDFLHDPKKWWEVIDRTTGVVVPESSWDFDKANGTVTIRNLQQWHSYTVSFLVYQIWEPVSMYNHIINSWTEEHRMPLDPLHPEARRHLLDYLDQWLNEHPKTDVVRFTTFFYNFDLIYDEKGKEKRVDWFGYLSSVYPLALEQFEKEYGYRLRPEDFIDQGYYNTPFRVPSKRFLDWMDFQQRFISNLAKECVELVHKRGKKAIMFLGDHWAGTEPYGKYFNNIGLDAVVGAAGDGVTLRMIADIPVKATEARFYPYFFPDVFHEGGDPVKESVAVWIKSRRALLRNPVDRIGYGGYLSLAAKFPDFIEHVADICSQFRNIHEESQNSRPYTASFKVAFLNAWGKLRAWQSHQVAHSLWNQRCYSYLGILEALSGMSIEVEFLSFEDLKKNGIPADVGVIINAGDSGTAWSGGEYWVDENVVSKIREWVHAGGGFIGVGEPTAFKFQGQFFQLPEILGVQKELGFSLSVKKTEPNIMNKHFITQDQTGSIDFGEGTDSVYLYDPETTVLAMEGRSISLAANTFGKGHSVYIAGMPYSFENNRLLLRAIYWAAGREKEMWKWFSSNPMTECAAFPVTGNVVFINNSPENQITEVFNEEGRSQSIELKPFESLWLPMTKFT